MCPQVFGGKSLACLGYTYDDIILLPGHINFGTVGYHPLHLAHGDHPHASRASPSPQFHAWSPILAPAVATAPRTPAQAWTRST